MKKIFGTGVLSGNQLKIIAAIFMTLDHMGIILFRSVDVLRIMGRFAFPIFAYLIAEGFYYTKNRKKYLFKMALFGAVIQLIYFVVERSLYQGIFVTFSLSIALCFGADNLMKKKTTGSFVCFALMICAVFMLTEWLPEVLSGTDFCVDYGFFGVIIPVIVFMAEKKQEKLLFFLLGLILLSASLGGIQWWCLGSVLFIAFYNGERGRVKMKNFFYAYYPLHLAVLYIVAELFCK